jgi:hypothetical protein
MTGWATSPATNSAKARRYRALSPIPLTHFCFTGRKPQQKRALFQRMAEILSESPGLRPQDLLINLVEVSWENWSFGNGQAHSIWIRDFEKGRP